MNINVLVESFKTLKDVHEKYSQNLDKSMHNVLSDSCVKRFEYTIETSIKLMRKLLKEEYGKDEKDLTINNIFRLMHSYGFITLWTNWREYYKQRNNTTHEYNLGKSKKLIEIIPAFIDDCHFFIEKINAKFSQEIYFKIIKDIIEEYTNKFQFYAYGSRVKGTFQSSSDCDILIKGACEISDDLLEKLKIKFDNSDLPFIVNLADFHNVSTDFYDLIKSDLVSLND